MKLIICFLFTFSFYSFSSEKDEVEKLVRKYMDFFIQQNWEELYELTHPKMHQTLKTTFLKRLPKTSAEIDEKHKETTAEFLKILEVNSVEEAWALDAKSLYLKLMKFTSNLRLDKALKMASFKIKNIQVEKKENSFEATVQGSGINNGKSYTGSRIITVEKHKEKLLVSHISKSLFSTVKYVIDKAGLEIHLPENWTKNKSISIEEVQKRYQLPPEQLEAIKEQLNAMLFSYTTHDIRDNQRASLVISKNELEEGYTLKQFLEEASSEIKNTPMYKDAKIVKNGCPKVNLKDYVSLYVVTPKFKQYTYVFFYKKKLISININTDKINVDSILKSITNIKSL